MGQGAKCRRKPLEGNKEVILAEVWPQGDLLNGEVLKSEVYITNVFGLVWNEFCS
jgi:hypothetical protein